MRRLLYSLVLFLVFVSIPVFAQNLIQSKDAAVLISVETTKNPPSITLKWQKHRLAYQYEVRRKNFGEKFFPQIPLAFFDSSKTSYKDENIELGKEYEYEVRAFYKAFANARIRRPDGSYVDTTIDLFFIGFGYVHTGVDVLPIHSYGKALILVDETIATEIGAELSQFEQDLITEGWTVVRKYVPRAEEFDYQKVLAVKKIILDENQKEPNKLTTIVLIGRVPVPYSGNIAPDGHPDHLGAWPCDMFYGTIYDDYWLDVSVNSTSANDKRNRNVPGDGKFDRSSPDGLDIDFAVGRIDFFNMDKFQKTEIELIRQYLVKNHQYRTGYFKPEMRGLIDDNFAAATYWNAFASSGWRNFAVLLGAENIQEKDWFTTLKNDSYIWAYGCGGGTYTSAGGIGNTDNFVQQDVKATFTMLFGSYFGDWDSKNNFMRAALASNPSILTCSWAGFPHWYFHNMAANLPIGYSTKLTQNNSTSYLGSAYSTNGTNYGLISQGLYQIHVALIGDPTLTLNPWEVPSPTNLSVYQPEGDFVQITWNEPKEPVDGYYVYRSYNPNGDFTLITPKPITETFFIDSSLNEGNVYYMVRSVKNISNTSGNFNKLSRGVIQSAKITSVEQPSNNFEISVFPNPAVNLINISISLNNSESVTITITNLLGYEVYYFGKINLSAGTHSFSYTLTDKSGKALSPGVYFVRAKVGKRTLTSKLIVLER